MQHFSKVPHEESNAHSDSHNMYFFRDPFASNMADLQCSNTVSHTLFIELQLEVAQDCDSEQNHTHC